MNRINSIKMEQIQIRPPGPTMNQSQQNDHSDPILVLLIQSNPTMLHFNPFTADPVMALHFAILVATDTSEIVLGET